MTTAVETIKEMIATRVWQINMALDNSTENERKHWSAMLYGMILCLKNLEGGENYGIDFYPDRIEFGQYTENGFTVIQ